jgi:putative ABC transport system permease protein
MAGGVILTRAIKGILFGVRPADPAVLVGVVLMMLAVAGTASLLPALRAASVDQAQALRYE